MHPDSGLGDCRLTTPSLWPPNPLLDLNQSHFGDMISLDHMAVDAPQDDSEDEWKRWVNMETATVMTRSLRHEYAPRI